MVELEFFDNLGAGSSDIGTFGRQFAGDKFTDPDWVWGTASQALTTTFDPKSYLDVYYLINAQGQIVYYNGAPDSTMNSLVAHVKTLGA
jgi:hypothetical protein